MSRELDKPPEQFTKGERRKMKVLDQATGKVTEFEVVVLKTSKKKA